MLFVLAQILAQLPLLLLAGFVTSELVLQEYKPSVLAVTVLSLIVAPAIAACSLYAHARINRAFEFEPPEAMPWTRAVPFGVLLSALALALMVGALLALGAATWDGSRINAGTVITGIALGFIAGSTEEVIVRGSIQRRLSLKVGAPIASILSCGLFALGHAGNPGASAEALSVLAVSTYLQLSLTYWLTGSLASCVASHFTWNALLFGIVGSATSGLSSQGGLVIALPSNPFISGGAFGLEASMLSVLTMGVAFAVLWRLILRRRESHQRPALARLEAGRQDADI